MVRVSVTVFVKPPKNTVAILFLLGEAAVVKTDYLMLVTEGLNA